MTETPTFIPETEAWTYVDTKLQLKGVIGYKPLKIFSESTSGNCVAWTIVLE